MIIGGILFKAEDINCVAEGNFCIVRSSFFLAGGRFIMADYILCIAGGTYGTAGGRLFMGEGILCKAGLILCMSRDKVCFEGDIFNRPGVAGAVL